MIYPPLHALGKAQLLLFLRSRGGRPPTQPPNPDFGFMAGVG
jgi:hypothetical protein